MNVFRTSLIVAFATLIVALATYFNLPEGATLPIHWNANGVVDRVVKAELAIFYPPIGMFAFIGLLALLRYLEPRKEHLVQSRKALNASCVAIVLLLLVMEAGYLALLAGMEFSMHLLVVFTIGLMLMVIGNYLGKTRSNFFIGIRTPWTLSSEDVWRKTHRLAGRTITVAGAITSVSCWFIAPDNLTYLIAFVVLPAAIAPTVYSWWLWRKEQTSS